MLPRSVLISPLWHEHAERLRALPGGEGVGAVALMKNRQAVSIVGVGEVGVEIGSCGAMNSPL